MKKCRHGFEVRVLKSNAGYYIGTVDEDGCPNCRISQNYYKTSDKAQHELDTMSFIDRCSAMENQFCAQYQGCMIEDEEV